MSRRRKQRRRRGGGQQTATPARAGCSAFRRAGGARL